jgi:hypothetical protein
MNLRALTVAALASLALAAIGCGSPSEVSGASAAAESTPAAPSSTELQQTLETVTKGLEFTSETDAPYDVFVAPAPRGAVTATIDADMIRQAFNGMPNTHDDADNLDLKDQLGDDTRDFEDWATTDIEPSRDPDPTEIQYDAGMKQAYELMRQNLTDLQVVLIAADSMKRDNNVGLLQVFVVGRATDGSLVALHTIAVWT